jgi:hypothetical protein
MTKTFTAQAACLVLAVLATVGTVSGVEAIAAQQVRTTQTLVAARAGVVQTAAAQTVVVIGRRIAKA